MTSDLPHYPAAERNKDAIAEVLADWCPRDTSILEIASGTGQHMIHFAGLLPAHVAWQPTELDHALLPVIDTRISRAGLGNVRQALFLDVQSDDWPDECFDTLLAINLLHVASRDVCDALFAGAQRCRCTQVALYGPFNVDGRFTSDGNRRFHDSLTAQNPRWGLRDVVDVSASAKSRGFDLHARVQMPANNLMLRFLAADRADSPQV